MRIIKIISAGLGLLLLAAIAWSIYLLLYLNENKGLLEARFSDALGREVRIEKGISAHWSLTPTITLEGLRIGNPAWAKDEYLVRADRALAQIDVLALIQQRLDVKELTIEGADVHLESAVDGRTNWSFGEGGDGVEVSLDTLSVRNSKVSHRWPNGEVHYTDIPEIGFQRLRENELGLKASLSYRGVPITASLTTQPRAISSAGERPFQGEIETPGTTLTVRGELKRSFELASLAVDLKSDSLNLDRSALVQRYALPLTGSLTEIEGRFKTTGSSRQAMLANLSGELKVGGAALTVVAEKGEEPTDLVLNNLNLNVAPTSPVILKTELVYAEQPYRVELSGGNIADLFEDAKSWKTLQVKATGQSEGKPFEINGDVGPLAAIPSGKDLRVNLQAKHGGLTLRGKGEIASFKTLHGIRLDVAVSGPSLSRLRPWLDVDLPESLPFEYSSQMIGTKDRLEFKGLKLTTGKSDISGDLSVPMTGAGPIEADLRSDILDLAHMLKPEVQPTREAPADVQTYLENELPAALFTGLEGSLQFKARRLRLYSTELEEVVLDARLHSDHLKFLANAETGLLTVDAELTPHDDGWRFALRQTAKVELGELIDRSREADERSNSPVSIDADLEGHGKSLKQMLNSMQGQFTMLLGKGVLSENISARIPLGGVLYSVLEVVDPTSQQQKRVELECAVIHLDVADGLATSPHGVALRTKDANLIGGGSLKLASGEIDVEFKTAPRKGLGLSVVGVADRFIRLTGTLAEPTVGVNPKSALTHGTAAYLTGGLSLLFDNAFRRLTSSSNPCETVQKSLVKQQGKADR